MEPEQHIETKESVWKLLTTVTPLSKYLAMILFIILPFLGGWIGYYYALEKMLEVERLIEAGIAVTSNSTNDVEGERSDEDVNISKSYSLAGGYVIESYSCGYIQFVDDMCYRLVRESNATEKKVIIHDFTEAYRSASNLNRQVLGKQYFPEGSEIIYFYSFIPYSSACCRIVEFNIITNKFTDLRSSYFSGSGDVISPSGRFIGTADGEEVLIVDITTDAAIIKEKVGEGETPFSSSCGYAGSIADLKWLNENVLQYGVYDKVSFEVDVCKGKLIEKRQLRLQES
jgi:hypothetical protein